MITRSRASYGQLARSSSKPFYQDRPFLLELGNPLAQSGELLPLSGGQRPHRAQAPVDLGLLHPVPQRLRVHPEITSALGYADLRRQDQRNRISPELFAVLRWTSHSGHSLPGLTTSVGCPSRRGNFRNATTSANSKHSVTRSLSNPPPKTTSALHRHHQ